MIGYWILLLIIAFIAYNFGSISTLNIASVFVFHRDLHRIGKKSMFISNFRRLFGYTGFLKLLLVELIRDFVPILLGGILMSFSAWCWDGFSPYLTASAAAMQRFVSRPPCSVQTSPLGSPPFSSPPR